MSLLLPLILGCSQSHLVASEEACSPQRPQTNEVRAKRIECEDELVEIGEANVGDWLLENAQIKVSIRNTPNRMTQLTGAGGTIIDAALWGGSDSITEIVPQVQGGWPDALSIHAESDAIVLTAEDGTDRQFRYTLAPNSTGVQLEGASGFTVVPASGSKNHGAWIQTGDLYLTSEGEFIDEGGWLHWTETDTLWMGSQAAVAQDIHQNTTSIQGETDGSEVQVALDGVTLFSLPVQGGQFSGEVPIGAEMRARRPGHTPSDWTTAATSTEVNVGPAGFLNLEVHDEASNLIPATLTWNGQSFALPDSPTSVPVGPGLGSGQIDAGPEFGILMIEETDIQGELSLSISLERVASEAAWVDFSSRAFPDSTERRAGADVKAELAAQGIDYAVLSAVDEVAQKPGSSEVDHLISVSSASRSGGPHGALVGWEWSASNKKAAHGASNWESLNPIDLLALMSKSGRRYTAVDATWLNGAGPVSEWSPIPDVIQVAEPSDILALAGVWDQSIAAPAVGDRTWVHVSGRTKTEILRGIFEGRTTASTGPQLHLIVDDKTPGDSFDEVATRSVMIDIENAGDIDEIALVGPAGETIQSWAVSEVPVETTISHSGWVCAIATGDNDWAVTSPVWLNRP